MLNNVKFETLKTRDIAQLKSCAFQIIKLIDDTADRHQDGDYIDAALECIKVLQDLLEENRSQIAPCE